MSKWHLPRRTFLRGLGTVMALPVLEAMLPSMRLLGAEPGTTSTGFPKRLAFVYVPSGINMVDWTPQTLGRDYEMPKILQQISDYKKDILVISGLAQAQAQAFADGGGDHARASATYLTGCHPLKTAAADIKAGISVDQIAANKIGKLTRIPSLELTCDRGQRAGLCDTGYSCAYQFNISWKSETMPMNPEVNPQLAFDRLFGGDDPTLSKEARAQREHDKSSVLDFVLDDARNLQKNLGRSDFNKVEEYLAAVRDLEQQIGSAHDVVNRLPPEEREFHAPLDYDFAEQVGLMYNVMALAFQADATRIATFIVGHEGSNRPYPQIGVVDGHHDITHHQGNPEKIAKVSTINQYHMSLFSGFLAKLKSIQEGDGTLLDNSAIVYGSCISDGNAHSHFNLPIVVAGKAGGAINTGRHIFTGGGITFDDILADAQTNGRTISRGNAGGVPMTNFCRSLLANMDVPTDQIGDSTGTFDDIFNS